MRTTSHAGHGHEHDLQSFSLHELCASFPPRSISRSLSDSFISSVSCSVSFKYHTSTAVRLMAAFKTHRWSRSHTFCQTTSVLAATRVSVVDGTLATTNNLPCLVL